jgi:DNA-binding NarL/FixJ family response regulator
MKVEAIRGTEKLEMVVNSETGQVLKSEAGQVRAGEDTTPRVSLRERDVALFAIKGMTTAEIAQWRDTSEGTVKAQTNAIYRKAGVTGRPQLLSLFIEDLMDEATAGRNPRLPKDAA